MPPPHRVLCDLCNRPIPPAADYVVKIEVYADPAMPAMSGEELETAKVFGLVLGSPEFQRR